MDNKLLKVGEVSMLIDTSVNMINYWYMWKRKHPEHPMAQLLPEPRHIGQYGTRYWQRNDVWQMLEFKSKLPQGRAGIMGDVTQKYYKKEKTNEN